MFDNNFECQLIFWKRCAFLKVLTRRRQAFNLVGQIWCLFRPTFCRNMTFSTNFINMCESRLIFVAPLELSLECPCQLINPPIQIISSKYFSFFKYDFRILLFFPMVALLWPLSGIWSPDPEVGGPDSDLIINL